ncbi:hypothetical protein [Haloferula sp. A504]|jgi:hypothetical protein|uniref:hypothetical protein n=1 Tax=Haloferula sp. A504 TaxID=3373601 RepID=UPI0031BEE4A1|nr:hypothetical protein [Verrucomicrobiaceae bacterium E54]
MAKQRILIQAVVALALVWALVAGVRAIAGSKRVTAEKISEKISEVNLEDWSEGVPPGAVLSEREDQIREVAYMYNKLDFAERDEARRERIGEDFFRRMAPDEKEMFVEMTVETSMKNMMRALDVMSSEERRKIVEDGLRQIEEGRTGEDIRRAEELSEDMLARITEEGVSAFFEETSAEAKLDLAPLMEAMDGVLKGLRGNEFRPGER